MRTLYLYECHRIKGAVAKQAYLENLSLKQAHELTTQVYSV
ncbi:hypothetical protein [Bartonella tribocorum]|nr:hypothetical protein [Bartonella tribocorum]